jgi:hypothetical protein
VIGERKRGENQMSNLDRRTLAHLDAVLEEACRELPGCGGDHETRKHVAKKLLYAAKKGNTTLGGLEAVARHALQEMLGVRHADKEHGKANHDPRISVGPVG